MRTTRGRVVLVGLLCALTMAGCGTSTVYLKHPQTGQAVTCGPHLRGDVAGVLELRGCAEDFQRQGYERVPAAAMPDARKP